jgi:hypothetical protein
LFEQDWDAPSIHGELSFGGFGLIALLSRSTWLNHHIPGKRLESLAVRLHDSDGDMARLAGLDVADDAGLARMRARGNEAMIAIPRFNACI